MLATLNYNLRFYLPVLQKLKNILKKNCSTSLEKMLDSSFLGEVFCIVLDVLGTHSRTG